MGNGQSRDGFADVLPSASTSNGAFETSCPKESTSQLISEAWAAPPTSSNATMDNGQQQEAAPVGKVPLIVGKISPPGHILELEEITARRDETSGGYRASGATEDRFMVPESVRKSRTLDAFADVCSEILPGFLYVSNARVARDEAKLRALGITHVINCCGELKDYDDGSGKLASRVPLGDFRCQVLKLLLRDDANEDLTPFLPQVVDYIASCRKQAQCQDEEVARVLIHCHQGVSRSCALAIAYVMLEKKLSYHEAAAFVKSQRAISSPNAAFICQLLEWEKDLQAFATSPVDLGGLYRLAPHSSYDPESLVLKRCYDPKLGTARQRQNMAHVRTADDKQRLLWTQGTFVFQSPIGPSHVVVWQGKNCVIPEAMTIAAKLVAQRLHMQTLMQCYDGTYAKMKIVEEHESSGEHKGSEVDHFNYAAELQWRSMPIFKTPSLQFPENDMVGQCGSGVAGEENSDESSVAPQLFILECLGNESGGDTWDQLTNYDSEDLTPDSAFLLCSARSRNDAECYVWLGESCGYSQEQVAKAAQMKARHVVSLQFPTDSKATSFSDPLNIERQDQESDAFWKLFEAGY
ncbi:Protein-tyrosine-phosphatase mkp1 [Phytophthora boehmeriae]|uniref:Protein-tyrosine-phosphatase mkp1 n=1 Tax=Phytophthora boehmeriae TaxID=109152 RepID=A0A8T1WX10_9STRA|nr:Protein-tyrosine-phosphatase mkp1 [Phytophthora boehmeriae]